MKSIETRHDQDGSILLIAVVLLLLLGLIGFAALDTVTRDQQVAGFQNRKKLAFFAAEAGIAEAFANFTTTGLPSVSSSSLGDTTIYPYGQPGYQPDPSVTEPLKPVGTGAVPNTSGNIGQGGVPTYQISYWKIRVQGNASGGSMARVEAVAGALIAN
jgi:hypothetical protein